MSEYEQYRQATDILLRTTVGHPDQAIGYASAKLIATAILTLAAAIRPQPDEYHFNIEAKDGEVKVS